jgi:outer membrane lipoprotein LolB
MSNISKPLFILLSLLLTGCPSTPIKHAPINNWDLFNHQQRLLTQWHLAAKLGYQSPNDSGSAWLEWHQQQRHFDIHLSGPFGAGATRLKGNPEYVVMSQPGKEQLIAASSAELTQYLLGLPLPVEALTYWVRGIPSPTLQVNDRSINQDGTLATLSQDNWQLEFSRYAQYGDWILPGKLSGKNGELSFKLIIKEWLPTRKEATPPSMSKSESLDRTNVKPQNSPPNNR